MRLFAALIPPEPVLSHLERALAAVRIGDAELLRWIPREQLHVTLAFYGEVPDAEFDTIRTGVERAAAAAWPLQLHVRGAGSFAGRTLWLGVGGDRERARQLMAACAKVRDVPRDRQRAHVTVARASSRTDVDVDALARALAIYEGPEWTATEVALVSSQLGAGHRGRPLHTVEARLPLGGAA